MDKMEPKETIYVHNLNEKIKKPVLKKSLHSIFSQFGRIVDIVACRGLKLKGQAWVVFEEASAATNALRQMQGFPFYEKPLRIEFAKTTSDVIAKKKGTFVPREKRPREVRGPAAPPAAAPAAAAPPQAAAALQAPGAAPPGHEQNPPNRMLLAVELPQLCNQMMLSMLFQQYHGYREVRMVPNRPGLAFIEFDNEMQATVALQGLNGFKLTPEDTLKLSFAR